MDILSNLAMGFSVALSVENLFYCMFGVVVGTAIGVLPGLGPLATIAMLLPLTYTLEPVSALIMLSGIYYGAQYGGSTTAILVNLPGESASVVTCLDGHKMALNGRAGSALAIAALGSFFAGTVGTALIAGFAPVLATFAFNFGPAEYFALMVLGLVAAVTLAHGSLLKAFAMVIFGLVLGCIGIDVNSGVARLEFGYLELADGIEFVAIAMGVFAFTDIIVNWRKKQQEPVVAAKVNSLMPNREEFKESWPASVRGTLLGCVLGLLPGGGATLSSFASYTIEKRISRNPNKFGNGAPAGVAGPESANNAGSQSSFIPMLTLGIPSNGVMALMIGAMMIHDIVPGPQIMTENAPMFWGLVVSMWIGNLLLLVLNLPMVGIWIKLLRVKYDVLAPLILIFCLIGLYSIHNQSFEIYMAAIFAVVGYLFKRMNCEPAPLLLGFILGPMMEENLRRALLLSRGSGSTFIERPISAGLLILAAVILAIVLMPSLRRKREEVFAEEEA
jgi:putative tricarboxylic transport membrane protein